MNMSENAVYSLLSWILTLTSCRGVVFF